MRIKNLLLIVLVGIYSCTQKNKEINSTYLENAQYELKNYDSLGTSKIMVVGTFHFQGNKEIMEPENHKWTLDMLLENIPDLEVVSS